MTENFKVMLKDRIEKTIDEAQKQGGEKLGAAHKKQLVDICVSVYMQGMDDGFKMALEAVTQVQAAVKK